VSDINGDGIVTNPDLGTLDDIITPDQYRSNELTEGEKNSGLQYMVSNIIDSEGNELVLRVHLSTLAYDLVGDPSDPISIIDAFATGENKQLGDINLGFDSASYPFTDDTLSGNLTFGTASYDLGINFSSAKFVKSFDNPEAKASMIGFTNVENDFSAKHALATVVNRIDELSQVQSEYGSLYRRLEINTQIQEVRKIQNTAARSRIMDADIASDSASLVRNQILQNAATSVLAQANLSPQLALSLLL